MDNKLTAHGDNCIILATPGEGLPPHWIAQLIQCLQLYLKRINCKKKYLSLSFSHCSIYYSSRLVLKPEKVILGIVNCTNLQLYKVQCTRSSKFNIQTRAAVARCCQVWCLTSRRGAEGSDQIVARIIHILACNAI